MLIKSRKRDLYIFLVTILLCFFNGQIGQASPENTEGKGEKSFDAGEVILGHVKDSHSWHIAKIGNNNISIPLPVILYDKDKNKLHAFLSSEFHHGHESHKGFKLTEEDNIVPVKPGTMKMDETRQKPLDFSFTKTVGGVFVTIILMLVIFLTIAKRYKQNPNTAPKGLQSLMEPLILFVRDDIGKTSIGEHKYERFMPLLLTMFFFIFFANLIGLIPFFPGGANITGNISVTLTLALITFLVTNFSGNKHYWRHTFNTPGVPWWLKFPLPLMPIVEVLGLITKPFVLMVRLFANILAGHIIILGFVSLIFIFGVGSVMVGYGVSVFSVAFSVFINFLELLVAFIQAYVFTLLTALYLGDAVQEAH